MKNVILLITDTYRYDNLQDRRAEMPVRTPELDRFLAERKDERRNRGPFCRSGNGPGCRRQWSGTARP